MHPLNPDIKRQLYIDHSNISHIINKVWWEGNLLHGEVEAANTSCGKDFDGLVRQGSQVAFSMRGVGPIVEKRGDTTIVRDPLTIFTYDFVIHPSHPEAYMQSVISKGNLNSTMSESGNLFIPLLESSALEYAQSVSNNIKMVSNMFDNDAKAVKLSESGRSVVLQSSTGEKAVVFLEDYLSYEINKYLKKL